MANWETDPREFCDVLESWRAAHGWSDAELARELRQPYNSVRAWLRRTPGQGSKLKPRPRRVPKLEALIRRLMAEIDKGAIREKR